ncbi:hypothetical protein KIN20_016985 [Parelaphostrongylus tenuis]|uniref:GRAM domain-containing protein n=1 Tax=Parelaphostrongylus tenuis TaxID=148309 RepID=A0AAD5QQC2_PARTN|nr:hypothetical protein KIN20_016985 [Parelaphostrongylus tenuis]
MSINTANTPDGRGVLIYNGEVILVFARDVVMTIEKNSNQGLEGKYNGVVYLTSHRVIYMPDSQKQFMSFEMPFSSMQDVHLEQPIFGANYLRGIAVAIAGSQLYGEVPWRLTFNKGGCIDFGRTLLEAVDRAERFRPSNAPPPYAPPRGYFYAAPPDYYAPSADGHNGLQPPTHAFPDRPSSDSVFMCEAPPPYSGVGPDRAPMPTEQLHRAGTTVTPTPYSSSTSENLRKRN